MRTPLPLTKHGFSVTSRAGDHLSRSPKVGPRSFTRSTIRSTSPRVITNSDCSENTHRGSRVTSRIESDAHGAAVPWRARSYSGVHREMDGDRAFDRAHRPG